MVQWLENCLEVLDCLQSSMEAQIFARTGTTQDAMVINFFLFKGISTKPKLFLKSLLRQIQFFVIPE